MGQNADYAPPQRSACEHCGVDVVLLPVQGGTPIWNHETLTRVHYSPCDRDLWTAQYRIGKTYIELGGTFASPAQIDRSASD